jgi:hypothetical protein
MASINKLAANGESMYSEYLAGVPSDKGPKIRKKKNNGC